MKVNRLAVQLVRIRSAVLGTTVLGLACVSFFFGDHVGDQIKQRGTHWNSTVPQPATVSLHELIAAAP